jgi:biotin carboxyl carrier protein
MNDQDLLPALRSDLVISSEAHGAGVHGVNITDPRTQKTLAVRGFEISICRMINGSRRAGEVVAAAQAVGIPLTVARLAAFVTRLGQLGFLVSDAPVAAAMTAARSLTWSGRSMWSAEIREGYQNALKDARLDRLEEAKASLTRLLNKAPDTTEAKVLLEWIEEQIASKAAGWPRATFGDVFAEVENEWAQAETSQTAGEPERDGMRRSRGVVAAALVAVLLLMLFTPVPRRAAAHWRIEAGASEQVLLQREGRLVQVLVKEGQWVEASVALARYDGSSAKEAAAALVRAKQELQQAEGAKKKAKKGDAAAAQRVADAAEQVKKLERERLVKHEGSDVVASPVAGYVRDLTVSAGSVVEAGQELCRIEEGKKRVVVVDAPLGVTFDSRFKVVLQGQVIELTRDPQLVNRARGELEGFESGAQGEVEVSLGWRSFAMR